MLRGNYLELCHEGHQGITKCHRRAQPQLLPTNLPGAKESDVPTTSKEFEYDRSDPQQGGPANSVETSQEEVLHTLDSDTSFSEEVGARTTDPERVVETMSKLLSSLGAEGRLGIKSLMIMYIIGLFFTMF
ncbi:hypothetical protein EB796_014045 [Bugula neritina]|uniref:Uncharacterized protein n=1 Tax=Bugula neritina TaxID=10212 RepID=A0A7J7JP19_BUGNE|nr:hypothetical protein EB796_014045 [Bugula neritina]